MARIFLSRARIRYLGCMRRSLARTARVTRRAAGLPTSGSVPDQAIRSWTVEGAYAAFEETRKGRLAPGMLADFVVLSDDVLQGDPARILKTHVKMTVLGGEVVYSE